ncbi:sigma-54-dependent transcriptional regulator [Actibacterium lipolyticum]|uniref:sigma-54-dependent transcriptional regulator n=1 Tax=Actibacterium lipolyticum TaxID=1524263 RepID=UPI00278C2484|nr:sigma-54 dependent transcriptional regulator [Actibacterium lipolyticum]
MDDEEHLRIVGRQTFELADIPVTCFESAAEALKHITPDFSGVLVTDIRMPGIDGVALLQKTLQIDPEIPVVLVTGHGDVDLAVECIKKGAYDFIEKPWEPERLIATVLRAYERRSLVLENRSLRTEVKSHQGLKRDLYGRSAAMGHLRKSLLAIAKTDVNVLISGSTGTGKEVAARLLHRKSSRRDGPFVHINCAALPEALIENELFGHEAGAFPGAMRARFGKLEHARGGVLCLDEIDLLRPTLQAKLLDVLHNKTVTRLGSNDAVALDFRVIALSKSNLGDAVEAGKFRSDLLYRLNVASLYMPDLDERREDIPGLFTLFASQTAEQNGLPAKTVPVDVLNMLAGKSWPGNVRELRNAAERYVLGLSETEDASPRSSPILADQVSAYEKSIIAASIAANDGQITATCDSLGLSRRTLYDKMQKHGLSRADFVEDT